MFFVNKIRRATICHSSLSIFRQGLVTGIPSSRQKRRKDLITDKENELVMEMYASLKRGDFKEHQKLKEDKRLSVRHVDKQVSRNGKGGFFHLAYCLLCGINYGTKCFLRHTVVFSQLTNTVFYHNCNFLSNYYFT